MYRDRNPTGNRTSNLAGRNKARLCGHVDFRYSNCLKSTLFHTWRSIPMVEEADLKPVQSGFEPQERYGASVMDNTYE